MDVKVITRHTPSNYGSLLQSIAIIRTLEQMGYVARIINYERMNERALQKVWIDACLKGGGALKRLIYTIVRYPIEKLAECRFEKMRKTYLRMTQCLHTHEELSELKADVFMTGSDQVWGPMMNGEYDTAYFLDFVRCGKKVSYAGSFGKTKFDEAIVSEYKRMLTKYDKIAVREDSAVKLLADWGLQNCVGQVIDPTLLLNKKEWFKVFNIQDTNEGDYVLIYQIHNDPNVGSYAKALAEKNGLKLLRVNPFLHQAMREGKFVCCPDVKRFLELINGAKFIVTDSFHGTCFAINFNKQFVEILPNNATGTRNRSILTLTGLSSRIVCDYKDFSLVDSEIDYTPVNAILDGERKRCKEVMNELLK